MSKIGQTLIVTAGDFCYRAGRTYVAGIDWIKGDNLRMLICCAQLSGVFLYKKIPFEDFTYTMSRMRGAGDIQTSVDKMCVSMNLEGVWLGREQILDFQSYTVDYRELEERYDGYWRRVTAG